MGRTDTREKILDKAERLMAAKGYSGFSYQDISRPLGIRNAAIHYHFPAKEDLGVALIGRYRGFLRERTEDFMANGGRARTQLEGFLEFTQMEACEYKTMCPMGTLTADYFNLPESMRKEARRLKKEMVTWLTRVMEIGRAQGEMHFEGPARNKALLVIAAIQGARQLSRVMGEEAIGAVIDQVRDDLYSDAASAAA